FQIFYGNLYYRISWIVSAFMIGMGFGITSGLRAAKASDVRGLAKIHLGISLYFWMLVGLMVSFQKTGLQTTVFGEVFFLGAAVLIGGLVGFEFPYANQLFLAHEKEISSKAGRMYAADLFGSSLGALLPGIFMIPVFGVLETIFVLAGVNFAVGGLLFYLPLQRKG
ncbi:MAG: hypothetical protein NC930_09835, partial [Candidatus Omnitrophica bacterium]|nr:hypothetical protein [Candidatus Omnitrophota bacterium]